MSLSETISILFRYGIDVIHWHYYIIYLFVYTLRYAAAWFDSGLPQNRMRNGCLWESSIRSATTWYEENAQNYDGSSAMNNWWRALCARKTFPAIVMTHHISLAADFYKPSAWNVMNETLSMQPEHTHREKHMNVCIALLEGAARVGVRTIFLPSEVRCLFVCLKAENRRLLEVFSTSASTSISASANNNNKSNAHGRTAHAPHSECNPPEQQ